MLRGINPTLVAAWHRNQFASWFDEWVSYVNVHHDLKIRLYSIYFVKLNLLIVLLIVGSSATIDNLNCISHDLATFARKSNKRISVYSVCIVNSIRFLTKNYDHDRTTQNYGISMEGEHKGEIKNFFDVLHEVIELRYSGLRRVVLFKYRWYDLGWHGPIVIDPQLVSIHTGHMWCEIDPYIFVKQARLVWYVDDTKIKEPWWVATRA